HDNDDKLPGNRGGPLDLKDIDKNWVVGTMLGSGFPDNTNTYFLQNSLLAPYCARSVGIWKCPADKSVSVHSGVSYPRVRSVSMNCYVGEGTPFNADYIQFKKTTQIVNPSPANTWVLVDEREDGINDSGFVVNMIGYDPPNRRAYGF